MDRVQDQEDLQTFRGPWGGIGRWWLFPSPFLREGINVNQRWLPRDGAVIGETLQDTLVIFSYKTYMF